MKQSLRESNAVVGDHGYMKLGGIKALWIRSTMSNTEKVVSMCSFAVVTNDSSYIITVGVHGSNDVLEDAEIKKVLESIRFGGK
jgi:hypothetical protein